MTRTIWIKAHLFVAAFLTPVLLLVAISGGLYLVGKKGQINQSEVVVSDSAKLDLKSATLEADVRALFKGLNIDHDFEYLKISGNTLLTRPTSREHYEITVHADAMNLFQNEPNLQKRLIELHKGHGPLLFKDFQKITAIGLLFILLSGTWLGISSEKLRTSTLITLGAGFFVSLALVMLA